MGKKIISCSNIEIEKRKFHHRKNLIFLKEVDIEKIKKSGIVSYAEKDINIGYKDGDHKIKLLNIILLKTSSYVNDTMVKLNR